MARRPQKVPRSMRTQPKDLPERRALVDAINQRGTTLAQVSRAIGRSTTFLWEYVNKGTPVDLKERDRRELSLYLGVDEALLQRPELRQNIQGPAVLQTGDRRRDLPVKGSAVSTSGEAILWNDGMTVAVEERPAWLEGAFDAYAVYNRGHSMEPRYLPGEMLYVNPAEPARPSDFVIVQFKDGHAIVKQLVRHGSSALTLRQLNPPDTFDVQLDSVAAIHRIGGTRTP